jgi:DNA-binding PadR family transcriptional regulator
MFGMRHFGSDRDERWAAGRGRHRRHGFGFGGRHGFGGGDMIRAGRMLATGDLRLIALALIAEQPRHGYEIIKVLEEKTAGWYSPSPGIVYPTLTFLEEAGYVTAQAEGAKKLYTITDEGRAHLDQNRDFVDAVLERLTALGSKIERVRRRFGRDDDEERRGGGLPPMLRAALEHLREVAGERLANDADAEAKLVEILARAAQELKKA